MSQSGWQHDLQKAHQSWSAAESKLQSEINDIVSCLEETIMPLNKFTRRKASAKGSTLYLPGLIKAINCALDLLSETSTRGPKMIFMITDGRSSSGLGLTRALVRAENDNVDVIAISAGLDKFSVQDVYSKWVIVAVPSLLSEALRQLFQNESGSDPMLPPSNLNSLMPTVQGAKDPSEIWKTRSEVFEKLNENMEKERMASLTKGNCPGSFEVNICFIIDCTGSMSFWMRVVQNQISGIVSSIGPKLKETWPALDVKLRFSVVPYRDYGDPVIPSLDFPSGASAQSISVVDHYEAVINYINTLEAAGGGDIPEDVLGGLNAALNLSWSIQRT